MSEPDATFEFSVPEEGETPESIELTEEEPEPNEFTDVAPGTDVTDPGQETISVQDHIWYTTSGHAVVKMRPHGELEGEELLTGEFPVLQHLRNGARQLRTLDGDLVWISPLAN